MREWPREKVKGTMVLFGQMPGPLLASRSHRNLVNRPLNTESCSHLPPTQQAKTPPYYQQRHTLLSKQYRPSKGHVLAVYACKTLPFYACTNIIDNERVEHLTKWHPTQGNGLPSPAAGKSYWAHPPPTPTTPPEAFYAVCVTSGGLRKLLHSAPTQQEKNQR